MTTNVPVAEVLNGLNIAPLEQGCIATDAVVLIKFLDEDGDPAWALRHTDGIPPVEEIGALSVMLTQCQAQFQARWEPNVDHDD